MDKKLGHLEMQSHDIKVFFSFSQQHMHETGSVTTR